MVREAQSNPVQHTFRIVDSKTGHQIGSNYTNRHRAQSRADKLDLKYGSVRYYVERIKYD